MHVRCLLGASVSRNATSAPALRSLSCLLPAVLKCKCSCQLPNGQPLGIACASPVCAKASLCTKKMCLVFIGIENVEHKKLQQCPEIAAVIAAGCADVQVHLSPSEWAISGHCMCNLFTCNMVNVASSAVCIVLKLFSVMLQLQPLTPLVDEFASRLFGELDYVQEGLSAEKFQVGGTLSLPC